MQKRIASIKEKITQDTDSERVLHIKQLEESTEKLLRENGLQKQRNEELLTDYNNLKNEFDSYREEKRR